jgi:hypothetical protein
MTEKRRIFVSHINEEKQLALILQEELETAFLDIVKFFVSSDRGRSLPLGREWFDTIKKALKSSKAMLVLCSHASITRPWINFEAGAAWSKNVPVLPICHSGMTRGDLPSPLNSLQGIDTRQEDGFELLVEWIARAIGCSKPAVDYPRIQARIDEFEQSYRLRKSEKTSTSEKLDDEILAKFHSCNIRFLATKIVTVQSSCDWFDNPYPGDS